MLSLGEGVDEILEPVELLGVELLGVVAGGVDKAIRSMHDMDADAVVPRSESISAKRPAARWSM